MININLGTQTDNFFPETVEEEVIHNIKNIIATMIGETPLFREFGLNPTYLDSPNNQTQMSFRVDLISAIKKHEPRAKVEEITFINDTINGKLTPNVRVSINELA